MVRYFRLAVALLVLGLGLASFWATPHASADIGPCGACAYAQVNPVAPLPGITVSF